MPRTTATVADGPRLDLAQVLRVAAPAHARQHGMPRHHWRTLRALMACRTPALGAHVYRCASCQRDHFVPHSCRNRHCPACQPARGAQWMESQCKLLLPIPYFHLVFTLPHSLNPLIAQNQAALYNLLFDAASTTLLEFGQNKFKATIGITTVLHTWSQTLLDHYHLHCIVTGGGMSSDGSRWIAASRHWLFPVRALSKVYRGKFCEGLQRLFEAGKLVFHGRIEPLKEPGRFRALLREACRHKWVVYAKRPFNGPQTVLAYLARYTHRVGLTNARLHSMDASARTVTFKYKDYANEARHRLMTLHVDEFVRRFRLHILPRRFTKIRHYGLLSNRGRRQRMAHARALFAQTTATSPRDAGAASSDATACLTQRPPLKCPHCESISLKLLRITYPPRRPPEADDTS